MALIRIIIRVLILLVGCVCLQKKGVEGKTSLSKQDLLELEKQLQLLDKPAVRTIKTIYGEIYGCIDFYQQPAFDHPSLKNHSFHPQMRRFFHPKRKSIWQNEKGCPFGTVPIKRTTKDELLRAKLAADLHSSNNLHIQTAENPGFHYAGIGTKGNLGKKFYGGGMTTSVYNPQAQGAQYTSTRIKIQNGLEFIEAGWTVNPTLYNDTRTRFFIYTQTEKSHCFNAYCPGFIHVYPDLPFGYALEPISKSGGPIYDWSVFIYKDEKNGCWFLDIEPDFIQIGWWPQNIFTGSLADVATRIEWGGMVYSPPDVPSPPMGAGFDKLFGSTMTDAYGRRVTIVNEKHETITADDTEEIADIDTYKVYDAGNLGGFYRHLFLYSGKGGYIGN